jgi:hypothetical protein
VRTIVLSCVNRNELGLHAYEPVHILIKTPHTSDGSKRSLVLSIDLHRTALISSNNLAIIYAVDNPLTSWHQWATTLTLLMFHRELSISPNVLTVRGYSYMFLQLRSPLESRRR